MNKSEESTLRIYMDAYVNAVINLNIIEKQRLRMDFGDDTPSMKTLLDHIQTVETAFDRVKTFKTYGG